MSEKPRKHQRRVERGIGLLNRHFRKRWLKWVDTDKLVMSNGLVDDSGCGCIGAQIALHSRKVMSHSKKSSPYTLCKMGCYGCFRDVVGLTRGDAPDYGLEWVDEDRGYSGLTKEWKRQIQELRG